MSSIVSVNTNAAAIATDERVAGFLRRAAVP